MKSLKYRISVVFMAVMVLLCLMAVSIAVRVATMEYERKHQIIKGFYTQEPINVQTANKPVNVGKLMETTIFFNGSRIEGVFAYQFEKNEFLLPLDQIFKYMGISYKYFAPDDTFEAEINGKRLVVRLGRDFFTYGESNIRLAVLPIAARDHILVPMELLSAIGGFKTSAYSDRTAVFINSANYSGDGPFSKIRVLRVENGRANISSPDRELFYWTNNTEHTRDMYRVMEDAYEPSPDRSDYILKSGEKVYIIDGSGSGKVSQLDLPPSVSWSRDGRQLFWIRPDMGQCYLYDVSNSKVVAVKDYGSVIPDTVRKEKDVFPYGILSSFVEGKDFSSITLTSGFTGKSHTFIERKGKQMVLGSTDFSPDRQKLLYSKEGKYYISGVDGAAALDMGSLDFARWVNNDRVFASFDNEIFLFDTKGKNRLDTEVLWKQVGGTADGGVLFTGGRSLYIQHSGMEEKLMELSWECSYAYGKKASGPYAVVSAVDDGVFHIANGRITKVGRFGNLLRSYEKSQPNIDYAKSISFSPDGNKFILFARERGFMALSLINEAGQMEKKLLLNNRLAEATKIAQFEAVWLSNDRLLVYTPVQGWVIDLEGEGSIYEWTEEYGRSIHGVIIAK